MAGDGDDGRAGFLGCLYRHEQLLRGPAMGDGDDGVVRRQEGRCRGLLMGIGDVADDEAEAFITRRNIRTDRSRIAKAEDADLMCLHKDIRGHIEGAGIEHIERIHQAVVDIFKDFFGDDYV